MKFAAPRGVGRSAFVLAMAVVTASAWGQVQRVQVGRALDANPLVGSGGSNQPISGYVPGQANGNDIISGNVAGLSYFHGRIDELSPYTFGAHLGSADLDAFERQSAGGIPMSYGVQPYFQPSTVVSTGQGSLYSAPAGSGFDSRIVPASAASPYNGAWIGGTIPAVGINQNQPTVFNGTYQPGRAIESPLFSLRPGWEPRTGTPSLPENEGPATPAEPTLQQLQQEMKPADSLDHTQDNSQSPDNQNSSLNGGNTPANPNQVNEQLPYQAQVAIGEAERVNGRPQDYRNQPIGPQQLAGAEPNDVYSRLQASLDKATGVTPRESQLANASGNNPQTPGKASAEANGKNGRTLANGRGAGNPNGTPNANGTQNPPNAFSQNPAAIDNQSNVQTPGNERLANNGAGDNNLRNGNNFLDNSGIRYQSTDPSLPGYRPRASIMERAQALANEPDNVLKAGKKVDTLKSLAAVAGGQPHTSFETKMQEGETLLKSGKFLEAANAYQEALRLEPSNPLALMGRGNAELAAGMFESAAYDLKLVFTSKPAMVGVRYELGDYIPASRQDVLIKDLSTMTTVEETGNLGSFLLCYLYYNTYRNKELDAELGRWRNRPWKDAWESVAEKAWGK